jgi:hypothetical protein
LIQDTTLQNLTIAEQESRQEDLPGAEEFLNTFIAIETAKIANLPEESPIKQEYFNEFRNKAENVNNRLYNTENSDYILPYSGICAEVNIFNAIRNLKGDIQPSSLQEDREDHFDFFINGYPVDVTCSPKVEDFQRKWSDGNYAALYIPNSIYEDSIPFFYPKYIDPKDTYIYHLVYLNRKDYNYFINRTIDINWKILKELYNYLEGKPTQFKEEEFNNISQSFIHNTYTILEYLSDLVGRNLLPLDTD